MTERSTDQTAAAAATRPSVAARAPPRPPSGASPPGRAMPATPPRASRSSRASRRSAGARACTSARPMCAACTTSSGRSSTTRSTRRWPATPTRIDVTIHADGTVDRRGRRPRHPGRQALDRQGRARGRPHRAPRRRQVRRRRLQGLRRPARRRRQRRQRAVRVAARRGRAATASVWVQEYERGKPTAPVKKIGPQRRPARHDDRLPGRSARSSRRSTTRFDDDRPAPPRVGLPEQGRLDHASSTSGPIASGTFYFEGGISRSCGT